MEKVATEPEKVKEILLLDLGEEAGMAVSHPSGDKRFKLLDAAMKKHQFQPDALLEVLHTAQELFGHLQEDLLTYVARQLKLPPSRVYGVATFYHFFTFTPKGLHNCNVCMGTACYVKGAAGIQRVLEKELEVKAGQTRSDGQASVSLARCLGACGQAPAVVFDGVVVGYLTPEAAAQRVQGWLAQSTPLPGEREVLMEGESHGSC
jgi:bidirectional [NiFe] hydrogenase diaphorase subunit